MPEWLVERGIGESRALLVDGDEVLRARLHGPGDLACGDRIEATLAHKTAGSRRGTALDLAGREILVDRVPPEITEGSTISIVITRSAIAERGRLKRAQGRVVTADSVGSAASESVFETGRMVRRFPVGFWEDVWDTASSGEITFAGGSLLFSVTPAMTVVDVDGELPARELALAAVPALARALRQFDLGGSIAVDFPTLEAKADRKSVDSALDAALCDWPHERTAMNGFGLVHLVARLEGPSLLHRFATARVGMAARLALRRAELVEGPGVTLLTVHPALKAKLKPEWQEELERRTARKLRIETDPGLAIEAPHAQIVPHE